MQERWPRFVRRSIANLATAVAVGACQAPAPPPGDGAPQLQLPASFLGALPCPGCAVAQAHLDLWPDGTFHLSRQVAGQPGRDDDLGRWRRDADRDAIVLYAGREMPLQFEVVGPHTLRALDRDGLPAGPGRAFDLVSDGRLDPTGLRRPLHGMVTHLADAPRFEECLTGRSYPVAMEGDYRSLERAWTALPSAAAGTPVMASFDGEITWRRPREDSGTVPRVTVDRFVGLWPGQTCERALSHASLSSQYWRIVRLRGTPAGPVDGSREPHLILRGVEHGYSVDAGCGRLEGRYRVESRRIRFDAPSATVACAAALRGQQAELLEVLADARAWRIQGQVLEFFDGADRPIAVLEAVHLR